MSDVIIKYNSQFNYSIFNRLTANEMDIFLALINCCYGKDVSQSITINLRKLKQIANYNRKPFFVRQELVKINDYLNETQVSFNQSKAVNFQLFSEFEFTSLIELKVLINPKFRWLFDNASNGWTRFLMNEFTSITSIYAKRLYLLLKQYRTTGYVYLTREEFDDFLGIPMSYKKYGIATNNIYRPIMYALTPIFPNFQFKKIRGGVYMNEYVAYEFTFTPFENKDDDNAHASKFTVESRLENITNNPDLKPDEKAKLIELVHQAKLTGRLSLNKMFDKKITASDIAFQSSQIQTQAFRLKTKSMQFNHDSAHQPNTRKADYDIYEPPVKHKHKSKLQPIVDWNEIDSEITNENDDTSQEQSLNPVSVEAKDVNQPSKSTNDTDNDLHLSPEEDKELTDEAIKIARREQLQKEFEQAEKELEETIREEQQIDDLPEVIDSDTEFYL